MTRRRGGDAPQSRTIDRHTDIDGYVRLRRYKLRELCLSHVCTLRDGALKNELHGLAISAGLTEWSGYINGCAGEITIGWDWYRDVHGLIRFASSEIRSNIMLIKPCGSDWGVRRTEKALKWRLERSNWAQMVGELAIKFLN
jgi:hypothetical protein